jgi:phosphatidate phosphatase PAH1
MGQLKTNYIHKGVCLLFNELYKRNYKILYMTARAIGQYTQTRRFLEKEVEESNCD